MTVDEVTTVNVAKEDLSYGVNEKTVVRGDTVSNGDGDYVFVNGSDSDNGESVASDLEKNGVEVKSKFDSEESCLGIVDQDKESVELCHVEDPVDEQKPTGLVESGPVSVTSVIVQNGVSDSPADDSVEADGLDFRSRENEVSEIVVADDCNDSAEATVSEVNVLNSSSKENEGSEIAVTDNCLANDIDKAAVSESSVTDQNVVSESLADDSVKDNVLDFRSMENEDSEVAVADEGDCNRDGLTNDIAEVTFTEANGIDSRSIDNEDSEMAVVEDDDCNGDALASDSAKTTVSETSMTDQNGVSESTASDIVKDNTLDFRSKENEGSEVAFADEGDCNGDGLANDTAQVTFTEANGIDSRSIENEDSEMVVVEDNDCNGDALASDSAKTTVSETSMTDQNGVSESAASDIVEDNNLDFWSKENEDSEVAVADEGDCNRDGLANDTAEVTFIEANDIDSRSIENEDSEMAVAEDDDCNGDDLASDSAKTTVSETSITDQNDVSESAASDIVEDNTLDFRSKENEGSEVAFADEGDCNGDGLANDTAQVTFTEANGIDSRSIENEDSEMAVAEDDDCNGDDLASDSAKTTVSEISIADQNGVSELPANDSVNENECSVMAVADHGECNGDGLANDNVEATVFEANVTDSRSIENEGSEMAVADDGDCNGNGLANDRAKVTLSEVNVLDSRSEENSISEMAIADYGKYSGVGLANDSAKATVSNFRSKESEGSEIAVANDCNEDGLANDSVRATVPESVVDTKDEQNGVFELPVTDGGVTIIAVSDSNEDCLPDYSEKEIVSESVSIDSGAEQNESSNSVEVEADHPCPVSDGNGDMLEQEKLSKIPETVLPDVVSGNEYVKDGESLTVADEFPVKSGSELEHNLEKETANGSLSDKCGEALQDVHPQDGIPETVQINESVDSSLNSQGQSSVLVESSLIKNVPSADVVEGSSSRIILGNNVSVESVVSDATTETFLQSSVDDEKLDTGVIKSDENGRVGLGSYHVDNLEIDVKVESGSIVDNAKSRCVVNGDDSTVSDKAEVSKVLVECHNTETDEKLVAVVDVQNDSNLAATVSNDEKAPVAVESVIQFGSVGTSQDPEGLDEVEKKSPFYFLIKVPRYDDENLKEKVRLAQISVDEKTQIRDVFRTEIQKERAACKIYADAVDDAISQERAIRDLHRSKRQEIDSIQSMMKIEDIDATIRSMEHMIQHETMPLKDEKQYIHQIKQYKQTRERISSNMGRQDEVKDGLDQIKERMKSLKKEADQLKANLMKVEAVTKAAKKEYHDESDRLNKLLSQFKAADDIRQESYVQLLSLKKESYKKNKDFYQYRDDAKAANDLALKGDKEALQNLCVNQVEKLMDLWNNNDEFREEYIRCNVRSTLRRLRTLDGRALGPDEEPHVIPPRVLEERVAKDHTVSSSTAEEQTQEKTASAKAETTKDKAAANSVVQKNQTNKSEKHVKVVPPASGSTTDSSRDKIEEAKEEKLKITKEEEEMTKKAEETARKAEESRKEEEAAKLREQRRLEEITKAKEALERKRRNVEKAQARAVLRAQKEIERKEKEREKRAKKKERRKGVAVGDASVTDETEPVPTLETPAENPKDSQIKEKPVTVTKRSQKSSQFTKQTKVKSVPPPLRICGKRKMQTWMWVLLTCMVILALFFV